MAKVTWRLQRITQIESGEFDNMLIGERNHRNDPSTKNMNELLKSFNSNSEEFKEEEKHVVEYINEHLELLSRYETTLENRLLKLLKYYHTKKRGFK